MNPGSSPEAAAAETDPVDAAGQLDASSAAPSAAKEDQGEKSLLDSVTEALGTQSQEQTPGSERDPVDPAAPQSQAEGEAQAKPTADDVLGDLSEDELKRYGPKTQRRMRQLLSERADARKTVDALKPKADSFDRIAQFAKDNRLSNDDIGVGLELCALIRNKPFEAFEKLTPVYRKLAEVTGAVLPDDLAEKVKLGYISSDDAKELARVRSKASLLETEQKESSEAAEADRRQRAAETHAAECRKTANDWEAARKGSDPDWPMKQELIGQRIKLAIYEKGYPPTQEGVVQLLDGILKEVNKQFATFKPQPKSVRPVTSTASSRATAEPKSALEAAELALGARS